MEGGTVYILQEFVFHLHCFCCPLHDFFWFCEGGYSTVTILVLTILERASIQTNLFYLSFTQSFCFTGGI